MRDLGKWKTVIALCRGSRLAFLSCPPSSCHCSLPSLPVKDLEKMSRGGHEGRRVGRGAKCQRYHREQSRHGPCSSHSPVTEETRLSDRLQFGRSVCTRVHEETRPGSAGHRSRVISSGEEAWKPAWRRSRVGEEEEGKVLGSRGNSGR